MSSTPRSSACSPSRSYSSSRRRSASDGLPNSNFMVVTLSLSDPRKQRRRERGLRVSGFRRERQVRVARRPHPAPRYRSGRPSPNALSRTAESVKARQRNAPANVVEVPPSRIAKTVPPRGATESPIRRIERLLAVGTCRRRKLASRPAASAARHGQALRTLLPRVATSGLGVGTRAPCCRASETPWQRPPRTAHRPRPSARRHRRQRSSGAEERASVARSVTTLAARLGR
jgi:hypothetical protein